MPTSNCLTYETIDARTFITTGEAAGTAGGTVLFFGIVRNQALQRQVTHLVYEAYEPLAERMIDELISKAMRIWPLLRIQVLHRLGRVEAGEIAVAIEVISKHRDEAYKASRFLIDQIKTDVPVWKKEYFEDGSYRWGQCEHKTVAAGRDRPLLDGTRHCESTEAVMADEAISGHDIGT